MEWSYSEDRLLSVYEVASRPPKKKGWKLFRCFNFVFNSLRL